MPAPPPSTKSKTSFTCSPKRLLLLTSPVQGLVSKLHYFTLVKGTVHLFMLLNFRIYQKYYLVYVTNK